VHERDNYCFDMYELCPVFTGAPRMDQCPDKETKVYALIEG